MNLAVPDYIWLNQVNDLKHQIIDNEPAKLSKNDTLQLSI